MIFLFLFIISIVGCSFITNHPKTSQQENLKDSSANFNSIEKEDPLSSFAIDMLSFELEIDRNNIEYNDEGWQVKTNLDYTIDLKKLYLVSYSLRLYPCETSSYQHRPIQIYPFDILISTAHAGHSDLNVPTNLPTPWIENWVIWEEPELQSVSFPENQFCEVIYTIARADQATFNQPDDIDMIHNSLYMEGSWTKEDTTQNFEISTSIPAEKFFSTSENNIFFVGEPQNHATLRVTRYVEHIFDDIDWRTETAERIPLFVLQNIMQQSSVEIIFEDAM